MVLDKDRAKIEEKFENNEKNSSDKNRMHGQMVNCFHFHFVYFSIQQYIHLVGSYEDRKLHVYFLFYSISSGVFFSVSFSVTATIADKY